MSLGALTACGDTDALSVQADLQALVGDWSAIELEVSSRPDLPGDTIERLELIGGGAIFRMNIQPSGQYTASLTFLGSTSTEIGTLEAEGENVTFIRQFPVPDTASGTITILSPDRIRLLGETTFDFDLDQVSEEADLRAELLRAQGSANGNGSR